MKRVLVLAGENFRVHSTNPLDLAEALAREGLEVTVAAPWDDDARVRSGGRGFAAVRIGREGSNASLWGGGVRLAARLRPDVVMGVNAVGFVAADVVRSFGLARRLASYALEYQLPDAAPRSLSVRWWALRARRADLVLATSAPRAAAMHAALKLARAPIVVENAPTQRPVPSAELRRTARAHGLRAERVVVYAGAINRVACLVEAVEASRLWTADAGLALVAFGGSSGERDALSAAIARAEGRAVLLPPVNGRGPLLSLLAGADAAVVLYDPAEGGANVALATPNKLYDALAAGLPVVTNDLPGPMREVLQAGAAAPCEPRNASSIAAAVDRLIGGQQAFAAAARRLFDDRFLDGRHLREAVRAVTAL
ncbi:MAG: hypothetical protein RL199_905 [Pseudomonadota bacterium]